jgi:ATP-dependent Lon protease
MSTSQPESTSTGANEIRRPVLALRNLVVFPGLSVPIRVGRAQSLAALREARSGGGPAQILATLQTNPDAQIERVQPNDLNEIGVLCEIEKVRGNENEGLQLILKGVTRVRLVNASDNGEYLEAGYEAWPDQTDTAPGSESLERVFMTVKEAAKDLAQYLPQGADQVAQVVENIEDLSFLTYVVAANLDLPIEEKQKHLAERSVRVRAERMLEAMTRIKAELQVKTEIRDKLTNKLGKNQREAILREQMRAIKEELGEAEGESDKADDYKRRIEESAMPDEVKKIARDEVKRLEALSNQSPETHVIRNYLDLLLALPWKIDDKETPDFDLKTARASLDADHFGLDKVKKRIVEHLATLKLRGGQRGMILLLIGPPGVGKTSLGSSIAKAMHRKFVRAALGGVRDDAEVRGHRRTYVGAMPGRIIQGI